MIFGPVETSRAAGSILAHSITIQTGKLRKGVMLTTAHVDTLIAQGITEVIVAQLEEGDIHEDDAATRLANSLLAQADGLRATLAATGRVNLIATAPGLAVFDADKIAALNAVHPMITFASVAQFHQLDAGRMLGTVKIISYAVPKVALDEACRAGQAAVNFVRPKGLTATLIITQIPGANDESKGVEATRARLEALGGTLDDVQYVPHKASELAKAIAAVTTDLTLILTGSATSDPFDVGPEGLRCAGGTVTRFGMPVDPGNLLFIGERGGKPVIGLPGCARSPALNGADLVLNRLLCGVPVTSEDIAGMGIGGLLKEIPTRPRPRRS